MTQYYYAPKAAQENTAPPEISKEWDESGTSTLTVKLDAQSVPYVHFSSSNTDNVLNAFYRVTQDSQGVAIPQVADLELYMEFWFNSLAFARNGDFRLCARADLASTGYAFGVRDPDLKIISVVSGTRADLLKVAASPFPAAGTLYSAKAKLTGTTLETKFWETGTAEPAYQAAPANSSITAAGHVGLYSVFPGNVDTRLYKFSIATAGDPVLTEDPSAVQAVRKGSNFTVDKTIGTITTATLNAVNVFDHLTGQTGTTVSFAGAATDEITTSGKYSLVLGDGATTETITVQVNVYGVAPSNNPVQKDGTALASLTGVQLRVTSGANINGTELFYSGTATTDASGNLSNIDLSSTAAADTDPVLLHMRTAAGDSIIASETVGLI